MRNTSKLLVCVCGCNDFCAIMCGKPLKNVCAGACVNHVLGPHVCFAFLLHKIFIFFTILSQIFFIFFESTHAGAGAKNGVRVRALHTPKICAMCVRCQKSAHTNSLNTSIRKNTVVLIRQYCV